MIYNEVQSLHRAAECYIMNPSYYIQRPNDIEVDKSYTHFFLLVAHDNW